MTFFDDCSAEKRDELVTFYHLKFGWSVMITEMLMKISADADEFCRNVEAANSLEKTLAKMHVEG